MSDTKWVPGPYMALPMQLRWHGTQPIFPDGTWHIHAELLPEQMPIASVDYGDDHDEATRKQAKYQALLFAAAPDLYRELGILRDAHATALELLKAYGVKGLDDPLTLTMADAALARAEGRE